MWTFSRAAVLVSATAILCALAAIAASVAPKSTASPAGTPRKHLGAKIEPRTHYLALQITDNSVEKMNAVLNVASNAARYYTERGEDIEIEIVAFNAGLHMLREDTSPVKERIRNFQKSMANSTTNVSFAACKNTMDAMEREEGHSIPILPNAKIVPAGVARLIELSEQGWTILRP